MMYGSLFKGSFQLMDMCQRTKSTPRWMEKRRRRIDMSRPRPTKSMLWSIRKGWNWFNELRLSFKNSDVGENWKDWRSVHMSGRSQTFSTWWWGRGWGGEAGPSGVPPSTHPPYPRGTLSPMNPAGSCSSRIMSSAHPCRQWSVTSTSVNRFYI